MMLHMAIARSLRWKVRELQALPLAELNRRQRRPRGPEAESGGYTRLDTRTLLRVPCGALRWSSVVMYLYFGVRACAGAWPQQTKGKSTNCAARSKL